MNKMNYKACNTVRTIPRSNIKTTSIPLTNKYMTAQFPGLVQALQ